MTIGVLVSGLYEEYTRGICQGIQSIANQDDINVVIIPGKYLELDLSQKFGSVPEYQYNSSFAFGEVSGFDGLIIEMASVSMFASDKIKKQFTARFQNIPHVYISYEEENSCNVYMDNRVGMLDGLNYLFECGNTKYAMIGGPVDNSDAISRKKTFFEFLDMHNLAYSDKTYRDGDFIMDCTEQINQLLDENPGVEAVICANDILARKVCDIVAERGFTPGVDISVMGYDDSMEAHVRKPSLSSIRSDFTQLGIESYNALLRVINGEQIKEIVVPTKFIKRDSFVSKDKPALSKNEPIAPIQFTDILKKEASLELNTLRPAEEAFRTLTECFIHIEDYLEHDEDLLAHIDNFSNTMNDLMYAQFLDIDMCRTLLDQHYQYQLELSTSKELDALINKVYMHLYRNISNSLYFSYEKQVARNINQQFMQFFAQEIFSFERGDDSSYTYLLSKADHFGIQNAYIYMYEEPKYYFQNENFKVPEYLLLKTVMENGKIASVSSADQRIHCSNLLNNTYVHLPSNKAMMLFPLYTNEELYGIIICDYDFDAFLRSGLFVTQLSSATKMIATLRSNDMLLSEYEDTLQVLKSNNIELENLSKSDYLTGLVNRRGFKAHAETLLQECQKEEKSFMILFADMNNLKIINDKYGHSDGDYALKQTGRILDSCFNQVGIAGRLGGDEFAIAIPCDDGTTEQQIILQINKEFDAFNQDSDKEYLIGIAAGAHIVKPNDNITLLQALQLADENLYKAKKKRSKNIFKNQI